MGTRDALVVGIGMVPRGEVGIIVAGIGATADVIDDDLFTVIVGMSILTTLLVPPSLRRALERPASSHDAGLEAAHGAVPASAMICATLSGAKKSSAGSVAACTLTKPSMAFWFPRIAPMSCCISGGGGCSCAKSSVNS